MIESVITIKNRTGLHARAAAKFVEVTSSYTSSVTINNGEKTVDGKSILSVMMLAASPGSKLSLRIDGTDETEVLEAIRKLVENNFGENDKK
jgi:phosphocarrier protein HPr